MSESGRKGQLGRRQVLRGLGAAAAELTIAARATPFLHVVLWFGDYPSLKTWCLDAGHAAIQWWPKILDVLLSADMSFIDRVYIELKDLRQAGVPAETLHNFIFIDGPNVLRRRTDPHLIGMVAHELTHVAQAYPQPSSPAWLEEGIADYVRYYLLLPDDPGRAFNPKLSGWWDGYQAAAGLLNFAEQRRPGLVRHVNRVMRRGLNGGTAFHDYMGAGPNAVWNTYLSTNPAASRSPT